MFSQGAPSGFYQKKPKNFGGFQGSGSSVNAGYRGEARPVKPGKDCEGNLVECNFFHKRRHKEYECYIKKVSENRRPTEQH